MNGKDLTMCVVVAALVGGAAGAAASFLGAGRAPVAAPEAAAGMPERLKAAENELALTRKALDDSKKSMMELQERVTAAEMKTAKLASEPVAAGVVKRARPGRVTPPADGQELAAPAVAGADDVAIDLSQALSGVTFQMSGSDGFDSFRNGMELRKLSDADRWEKARTDLGLTWNQVEDLKKAVADRDAAIKAATTTETRTGPNGGTITIQRPDEGKMAHAQADYHDRMNATLNDDQKKSWKSKGYDHAFGSSPFGGGGAMVMAIDVQTDKTDAPAKEPAK